MRYHPSALEVEVCDDGAGMSDAEPGAGGHGLIGMRERVSLLGGRLRVGHQPGGGFSVRVELPLDGVSA